MKPSIQVATASPTQAEGPYQNSAWHWAQSILKRFSSRCRGCSSGFGSSGLPVWHLTWSGKLRQPTRPWGLRQYVVMTPKSVFLNWVRFTGEAYSHQFWADPFHLDSQSWTVSQHLKDLSTQWLNWNPTCPQKLWNWWWPNNSDIVSGGHE